MTSKTFITKSRAGHYAATVRVTTEDGLVFKRTQGKLNSLWHAQDAARSMIAQMRIDLAKSDSAAA